jgi:hypothetical protein
VAQQLGLKMGGRIWSIRGDGAATGEGERDVLAVTSDSRGSGKLGPFAAALPEQIVELGHRRTEPRRHRRGAGIGGKVRLRGFAAPAFSPPARWR